VANIVLYFFDAQPNVIFFFFLFPLFAHLAFMRLIPYIARNHRIKLK